MCNLATDTTEKSWKERLANEKIGEAWDVEGYWKASPPTAVSGCLKADVGSFADGRRLVTGTDFARQERQRMSPYIHHLALIRRFKYASNATIKWDSAIFGLLHAPRTGFTGHVQYRAMRVTSQPQSAQKHRSENHDNRRIGPCL